MGFTVKINLFKYKRFKDGRCRYKNTGSRHLKKFAILITKIYELV